VSSTYSGALRLGTLALLAALGWVLTVPVRAQGPNAVALVIQYGDGTVATYCVAFEGPEIRGFDALARTGVPLIYEGNSSMGARVCKIGPDGCNDPGSCFCHCTGRECMYWSYWHLVDGAWQYAIVGPSLYKAQPGAVEGWVWGIGTPNEAPEPPLISFEEVCRAPTATPPPTGTPLPTETPARPPTSTPEPTQPSTATATAAPNKTAAATAAPEETAAATAAPEETAAPKATATPTEVATATPTSTATPVPPSATPPQQASATTEAAAMGAQTGSYAVFGGIVVVLGAVAVFVLRRRE
jgi:hypothetical protein